MCEAVHVRHGMTAWSITMEKANKMIIIIIIIIIGFSVYLHNSPGDITQFSNKSMQKTEKF